MATNYGYMPIESFNWGHDPDPPETPEVDRITREWAANHEEHFRVGVQFLEDEWNTLEEGFAKNDSPAANLLQAIDLGHKILDLMEGI